MYQADGLAEFERTCGDTSAGLTLDLHGLRQADEASLALLRRLRAAGVIFEGLSSYLTLRLGPVSPEHKPSHAPASLGDDLLALLSKPEAGLDHSPSHPGNRGGARAGRQAGETPVPQGVGQIYDQGPPVNSFRSLTMHGMPARPLTANPLNRYLINSAMLPDFKQDADGGITLYVQK